MRYSLTSGLPQWLKIIGVMSIGLLLAACVAESDQKADETTEISVSQREEGNALLSDSYGEVIYTALLAEFYAQKGNYPHASRAYSRLLLLRADEEVAQRATELAIKSGDYDQALLAAQQWKSLKPGDEVNQYLVLLYQQNENYKASADVLNEIVKASPVAEAQPLDVAVALLERQADVKAAYYTLKQYLHTVPSRQTNNAYYYLGLFAMRANLYDEALMATQKLKQISDKELQRKAALLRVKAYSAMDRPEQALEELKQLIAEAADPATQQNYARLLASLGKTDEAVALLSQVFEKYPDKPELLLDMIAINLGEKKYQQSLPLVDTLQAIKGQTFNAHYYRGLIFQAQQKYPQALQEYAVIDKKNTGLKVIVRMTTVLEEVKGLDETLSYLHQKQANTRDKNVKADLYLLESEILRKKNRPQEALIANKKAEQLLPMDVDIIYSQALLYEDIKQIQKSEEKLHRILDIDSNHSAALNALGYMLSVHTSRLDEAYAYIKKAYALRPDDPAIIDSLGWVAYRKGNLKDAEHYLRLAYQKLQDPEVASHLVEVLTKRGQKDEASRVLKEMLAKHPENKLLKKIQEKIE